MIYMYVVYARYKIGHVRSTVSFADNRLFLNVILALQCVAKNRPIFRIFCRSGGTQQ